MTVAPARPAPALPLEERATTVAPWFRRWPRAAVWLAAALFAGVLAVRLVEPSPEVPVGLLYCLPVALLAVAFGRTAGLLAGALSILATSTWALVAGAEYGALSWTARTVPLLLLGGLLGDATDRLVRSEELARHEHAAALRAREAVELNDTVVQGLAAAKWALEAGRSDRGLEIVSETLELSQRMVSQLLRDAEVGLQTHSGTDIPECAEKRHR